MTCFFIQCWIHEMVRMTALNFVSAGILQCPEGAVKEIWRANRLWTIDVCCNSTLFNARPKTSWKSCQSSWRNWRSRPSTRQVGRLQIVNSKLTIGQKSLDNMSLGFQCDCLRYIFPPLLILRLECNIQSIFMKTNLILLVAEDGSVQSYWWQP